MSNCNVITSLSSAYTHVSDAIGQGATAVKRVGQEVGDGLESLAQGVSAVYTEVGQAAQHTYDAVLTGAHAVGSAVDTAGKAVSAVGDAFEAVGDAIDDYGCGVLDVAAAVAGDIGTIIDVLV